MATKSKSKEEVRQEQVETRVSKFEQFYENYKKVIWGVLIAVLVIWLAVLGYQKYIYQPKCAEAQEQAFPAETNFQQGNYEIALNGDGNVLGFAEIIDSYGIKAGKAVYLYAGICELQLGNFENAISYLKKYNGKEDILKARALACEGDAYVGLEDYKSAVAAYEKAVAVADISCQGRSRSRAARRQGCRPRLLQDRQGQIPPEHRGIRHRPLHRSSGGVSHGKSF